MRVLGVIPARGGSVRLPGKNMLPVGGVPLVSWALRCAMACDALNKVVVSSDDPKVLELAESAMPGSAVLRPEELTTAKSPAVAYLRHALDRENEVGADPYDAVVILQPTSPFRVPDDIEAALDALQRNEADSAVTITRVAHDLHPWKFKVLDGERLVGFVADEGGRRSHDELPPVYVRDGGVYAIRVGALDHADILGPVSVGVEVPRERSIDINEAIDLELAEVMWNRLRTRPEFAWLGESSA